MAKLKMTQGSTYASSFLGPDRIVRRGEVVEVPQDKVDEMLAVTFFDASNNEHHYFELVEGDAPEHDDDEDDVPAKSPVKAAHPRKRKAAGA